MSMALKLLSRITNMVAAVSTVRSPTILLSPSLLVRTSHILAQKNNNLCENSGFRQAIGKHGSVSLLTPDATLLVPSCTFKVKGRLKRRCKDCYFVVRGDRWYNICETHPRHKQMSMKVPEKKTWILTHATQSKERGW